MIGASGQQPNLLSDFGHVYGIIRHAYFFLSAASTLRNFTKSRLNLSMRDGTSPDNPIFFWDERHDPTINILENAATRCQCRPKMKWLPQAKHAHMPQRRIAVSMPDWSSPRWGHPLLRGLVQLEAQGHQRLRAPNWTGQSNRALIFLEHLQPHGHYLLDLCAAMRSGPACTTSRTAQPESLHTTINMLE
jgi:hypothetical protein